MNWHDYFTYDAETGDLVWKERPRGRFHRDKDATTWNGRFANKVAGVPQLTCKRKYRSCVRIRITHESIQCNALAHRIIWEMHHGPIPDGIEIDHRDGDPWNNRLPNLRLATKSENMRNQRPRKNCSSKYKGVWWSDYHKKWRIAITIDGKRVSLGLRDSEEDASEVYKEAAIRHHGNFARLSPDAY